MIFAKIRAEILGTKMETAVFMATICALALMDVVFSRDMAAQYFGQNTLVYIRGAIKVLLFSSFLVYGGYSYFSTVKEHSCEKERTREHVNVEGK